MRRKIGKSINGQQVDPRGCTRLTVRASRPHDRPELLGEAQEAEVVDVHLPAGDLDAVSVEPALPGLPHGEVSLTIGDISYAYNARCGWLSGQII